MGDGEIVDLIQEKRADNNVQWMAIVRLALEARPEETKAVLRQIRENDSAITDLTLELAR